MYSHYVVFFVLVFFFSSACSCRFIGSCERLEYFYSYFTMNYIFRIFVSFVFFIFFLLWAFAPFSFAQINIIRYGTR